MLYSAFSVPRSGLAVYWRVFEAIAQPAQSEVGRVLVLIFCRWANFSGFISFQSLVLSQKSYKTHPVLSSSRMAKAHTAAVRRLLYLSLQIVKCSPAADQNRQISSERPGVTQHQLPAVGALFPLFRSSLQKTRKTPGCNKHAAAIFSVLGMILHLVHQKTAR